MEGMDEQGKYPRKIVQKPSDAKALRALEDKRSALRPCMSTFELCSSLCDFWLGYEDSRYEDVFGVIWAEFWLVVEGF